MGKYVWAEKSRFHQGKYAVEWSHQEKDSESVYSVVFL